MTQQYEPIARKTGLSEYGAHLVHFVLKQMHTHCIFPPALEGTSNEFYSPRNVCAAIFAYLRAKHPGSPLSKLQDFGIRESTEIGKIVDALQSNNQTKAVKGLEVHKKAYKGLFGEKDLPAELLKARWFEDLLENATPKSETTAELLKQHFRGIAIESLVIIKRQFPGHVRADLQVAINQTLDDSDGSQLFGLSPRGRHEGLDFCNLADPDERMATRIGPLTYTDVDVGGETVACLANGLWLGFKAENSSPYAVLLGSAPVYSHKNTIQFEIAVSDTQELRDFAQAFMNNLQQSVESSKCYRGKILSFERTSDYRGYSAAIKVHELREVSREEVILPQETLDLLDKNVIEFVGRRPALAARGMGVKKGLLLFGPPGTGKTHTVHYLSRAMPGTTTLIISAEQVGLLSEYMSLARLLQPSLVVIEDADLIARQREEMDTCEEVLLNKLLNEMDGLQPDAEVIFLLTTNRPQALEAALTARPGRIDQAIEYPLPNNEGRTRLAKLYAGNQELSEDVVDCVVSRTDNASAAFIKELMRRATQYCIVRSESDAISTEDVQTAIAEMLFSGGAFNRQILGGGVSGDD